MKPFRSLWHGFIVMALDYDLNMLYDTDRVPQTVRVFACANLPVHFPSLVFWPRPLVCLFAAQDCRSSIFDVFVAAQRVVVEHVAR